MEPDPKSRVDAAVPKPDAAGRLSEDEKQALELSGEIEHKDGPERVEAAQKAEELSED